ncbi:MarR family transcriptional regulator [Piscinibacter sp.]|jgi:DNA-binding MarR family transcriptional regulator|uniref:MarR family winged helix-turn-helix transcriptional regulator n=1 Tax=Piscinibacter sp. TaxID=1903157 RepID=UPI001B721D41|nr:MarR family transcriptional regulator [Piscinibacter sp.]MBK7533022.1 MarR family transcriptional regulator [Piscinibacter sp.]MBP6542177.1 MarR family transcriptional regulator [Piscinibacter sp.]HOY33897.1 MarR family transcriptional regulator [Piscinibacter sp.]HPG79393.1 MarR family transcriptional regulator [Piscinibacter sp.]
MSSTKESAAPVPFPRYDGDRYDVGESVGHQLVGLVQMMRREVEARMARHGLTDAQWRPLWMIKTGRAATANELAREACIDAGAITRMLDRLEAKGLVERVRSETDRRVVHVRLTEAGELATANIPHVLASVNNDFLHGFSEREWRQLRKLVERMTANGQALQAAQEQAA